MTINEMLVRLETLKAQIGGDTEVAICMGGYGFEVLEVRLTDNEYDYDIEDGVPAIIGII